MINWEGKLWVKSISGRAENWAHEEAGREELWCHLGYGVTCRELLTIPSHFCLQTQVYTLRWVPGGFHSPHVKH